MSRSSCGFRSYSLIGLIAFLGLVGSSPLVPIQSETKSVHVIFRHGDRAPDNNGHELYPKDPHLNYSFFPAGLGQLTNDGKRREYALGKALREKYGGFLGTLYEPQKLFACSSDYDRTKMSLQLVLAGLYPPNANQTWNTELKWQPIATSYKPRIEDNLITPDECPLYIAEHDRVMKTPEVSQMVDKYRDLMNRLTIQTGKNMTTLTDLYYLYHTLMAEYSMGLDLPSWAYEIFPYGELWNATTLWYQTSSYNDLLKRLYAGPILRQMVDHMQKISNGNEEKAKKLYLYSGHETNVAAMLKAFNIYQPHVPHYSSAVVVELLKLNGGYYVQVYYYTGIPPVLVQTKLPGCEDPCPLNNFLTSMANLIPSDDELICDKTQTPAFSKTKPKEQEMLYNVIADTKKSTR